MRRLTPFAVTAVAAAAATIGFLAPSANAAPLTPSAGHPATAPSAGHQNQQDQGPARVLPPHVYAPYFETYDTTDGGLAQLAFESGTRYLSLAFLQTDTPGSCTAYWNGDTSTPISATAAGSFGAGIAKIEAAGCTVIPSFGGYTADTTNTELADSCTSVSAIAEVYEQLAATYHITRIDLDVEANSLTDTAGIERRNEAIAETEAWAAGHHKVIQFDYTIPVNPTGLTSSGLAVLQDAVAEHARITEVNIMTFDYYIGTEQDMLADTEEAATTVESQLATLYPGKSPEALWHMIGVTEMPGIDDFGPDETFTTADAPALLRWAQAHGLGLISAWALQRDNGSCPGAKGAGNCSGVTQPDWYFSHTFEPFSYLR
ncbi:MAG: chitinase [Trebonia sp.]